MIICVLLFHGEKVFCLVWGAKDFRDGCSNCDLGSIAGRIVASGPAPECGISNTQAEHQHCFYFRFNRCCRFIPNLCECCCFAHCFCLCLLFNDCLMFIYALKNGRLLVHPNVLNNSNSFLLQNIKQRSYLGIFLLYLGTFLLYLGIFLLYPFIKNHDLSTKDIWTI